MALDAYSIGRAMAKQAIREPALRQPRRRRRRRKKPAKPSRPGVVGETARGLLGYKLLQSGMPRTIGAARLFHGTSSDAWKKIQEEGLKAMAGGAGHGASAGIGSQGYIDASKGFVHTTPYKSHAKMITHYAGGGKSPTAQAVKQYRAGTGDMDAKTLKQMLKSFFVKAPDSKIIEMSMPYHMMDDFIPDPDMPGAIKTKKDIATKYLKDTGIGNKLQRAKEFAKHFPSYVAKNPGRFGLGLGLTAGGTYLIWNIIKRMRQRMAERGKNERTSSSIR